MLETDFFFFFFKRLLTSVYLRYLLQHGYGES